ncbi:MAG TPA: HAD family hydrolase [Thermoanaerobaculia bacterium]|nr:HAD family hydrolase [Thermoanaerobaculia bacterium]
MKLQALLLDIDGTLLDSNDIHAECWVEAFQHFGKTVPFDVVRHQIGKGGDLLVPDLCNAREMREIGEKVGKYRTDLFRKKYMKTVKPFPRVKQNLEALRARGVRLALASSANAGEVEYYTGLLGVADLIEASTSKDDAEVSKPSPDIFEAALESLGSDPKYTAVVGDTPYDILAAHRMALPVVAVRSGGFEEELLAKAEFLFENVEEMVREIDRVDDYFHQ